MTECRLPEGLTYGGGGNSKPKSIPTFPIVDAREQTEGRDSFDCCPLKTPTCPAESRRDLCIALRARTAAPIASLSATGNRPPRGSITARSAKFARELTVLNLRVGQRIPRQRPSESASELSKKLVSFASQTTTSTVKTASLRTSLFLFLHPNLRITLHSSILFFALPLESELKAVNDKVNSPRPTRIVEISNPKSTPTPPRASDCNGDHAIAGTTVLIEFVELYKRTVSTFEPIYAHELAHPSAPGTLPAPPRRLSD